LQTANLTKEVSSYMSTALKQLSA